MESPVFIIGNPRSGTTLLRLMMTCHRNMVVPPECGFAVWLYDQYRYWGQQENGDSLLARFVDDLMSCRKIETWGLERVGLYDFLSGREPRSYSELVAGVYEWYALSQGKRARRWGDKNNFYIHHIRQIKTMFPDAFFVHIVRDGRDVACSYKKLNDRKIDSPYAPNLPSRIEDIANQWKTNIGIAARSFAAIEWENVCEINFSDLILDPETSLRNLCKGISEDYDPSMLTYEVSNSGKALEPVEFLRWKEKTLRPPIRAEVGRYASELTSEEIRIFESIAEDELRRYGFM